MRIVDEDEVIYIIDDFNGIVLGIPYYVESECGIESPYANDKKGAIELATKIIEEFY